MSDETSPAYLLKALRKRLDLSQAGMARTSGGLLTQDQISKVETGANKASSADVREGFANAFGVSPSDINALLAGRIGVNELAERANPPSREATAEIVVDRSDADASVPADDDIPLERLVVKLGMEHGHRLADIEAARRVAREAHRWIRPNAGLDEIARAYLNAARLQRTEGGRTDVAGVSVRASILLSNASEEHITAASAEENARARRELDEITSPESKPKRSRTK